MKAEIDKRLTRLYEEMFSIDVEEEITTELCMEFCRVAYTKGHLDALEEPNPYEVYDKLGYKRPIRRKNGTAADG